MLGVAGRHDTVVSRMFSPFARLPRPCRDDLHSYAIRLLPTVPNRRWFRGFRGRFLAGL